MKALSVRQPFATWIAQGRKTYEIRSWKTLYRGRIIICSGREPHKLHKWVSGVEGDEYPTGVGLCEVELYDIIEFTKNMEAQAAIKWKPNHWAWCIKLNKILPPYSVTGKQGLFEIENKTYSTK